MMRKIIRTWVMMFKEWLVRPAVYVNFPWPEAYRFMGFKYLKTYKKLVLSNADPNKLRQVLLLVVFYLEKYISFPPKLSKVSQWIDANFRLSGTYLNIPKAESIGKASQVGRRVDRFIKNLPAVYNIPEPDIAFIPRHLAIGSLGVYENLESYLKAMALGLVLTKKLFFLVDSKSKVNNLCYLNYWGKHVAVVRDDKQIKKLSVQEKYLTLPMLGIFKQYGQRSLPMQIALGDVREQWIREKHPPLLTLTDEDKRRGWEALASQGVPRDAWFVCFHVREPGWRDKSAEVENARNAKIQTYFTAMKSITDACGWVIRMGDPTSMTPLSPMDRVIDYAHSDLKSDWMDVFLCSQCRFLVGTSSGVYTIASAFGVPCVITNHMPPHNMFALASEDIVLVKVCRSKKENRFLTFQELISPPVGVAMYAYKDMGIEALDNTPDEIQGAVEEMLARCDGTLKYSPDDESLQTDLKSIVKDIAGLYGDKDIEFHARMGREFLRNHSSLLPAREVRC